MLFPGGSCKNVQPTIFLEGKPQLHNLSVYAKIKEANKLWKIRPCLKNLRQNSLKVPFKGFNSVDKTTV